MSAPLISVRGLCVTGSGRHAQPVPIVRDVSFDVRQGEVLALIGESGSGKTTIALTLMGYARPGCRISAGEILVAGYRVDRMTIQELRAFRGKTVSYVAQNAGTAFNPALTVMAQVLEPALAHWVMPRREAERKAVELFRAMALPDPERIGARYPHELSGGQLQRLMAAMALMTDPEIVIFDEPTTALDVTTQVDVLQAFRSVIADRGITGVYVTHDLAVVAQIADRAVVLRHGTVQEAGSAEQILLAPREPYSRELVAASRIAPRAAAEMPDQDAAPVLTVSDLVVGYGPKDEEGLPARRILNRVSLTVPAGGTLGIIGESGCGKSTMARAISGLQSRAAGSLTFRGEALAGDVARRTAEQRRRLQLVSQNADLVLNPAWTIGAILDRVLVFFHGMDAVSARAETLRLLELVKLPPSVAERRPGALSGGQKQRVNLARALAARPDLILCDEITAALDPVVAAAILDTLAELQKALGLSCIFITHDLHALRAVCDRVAVLLGGHVVEECDAASLLEGVHHPYTRLLSGSVPEMRVGWLDDVMAERVMALPETGNGIGRQAGRDGCPFVPRCGVFNGDLCVNGPVPVRVEPAGHRHIACTHTPEALGRLMPDFQNDMEQTGGMI
ncbi:ATP-binding cassette domain-containing protein [Acetobacter musti]|uniref:ATP-binding cassette domain-containing protein n=1 Tax=Acetobacter musti TaxID=864732 RepID=A0ABX0JU33_9PROT|nr:ABC transporter ATP-binding protein [Acetobacter musti]NHN85475.1 ATP-binding cassette domain-containing protein [Acetobacter musti]